MVMGSRSTQIRAVREPVGLEGVLKNMKPLKGSLLFGKCHHIQKRAVLKVSVFETRRTESFITTSVYISSSTSDLFGTHGVVTLCNDLTHY
jgi:hypothetical protein